MYLCFKDELSPSKLLIILSNSVINSELMAALFQERWAAWKAAGRAIAAIQLSISFVFIITSFTITGGFVRGNLSEIVQLLLLRCFPENLGSFHVH